MRLAIEFLKTTQGGLAYALKRDEDYAEYLRQRGRNVPSNLLTAIKYNRDLCEDIEDLLELTKKGDVIPFTPEQFSG